MEYNREAVWDAMEADIVRRSIAAGMMDEPEDAEQYARGLEVLSTARVVMTERTTIPRLIAPDDPERRVWWYEVENEINLGEIISPVYVFEVGHIATSPAYIAVALVPRQYATANEAAAFSGRSESHWRNRAAAGQIPGAVKRGATWLIPWPQPAGQA